MPIFQRPALFIMNYKNRKTQIILLFTVICTLIFYLATRPCLFVLSEQEMLLSFPVRAGTPFSIRFIHSVQKTPVLENLTINQAGDGFMLVSTKYQSFGVGLPFLADEGQFRQEGDYFIMDHMDRAFHQLAFRTGVGTQFTLIYQGAEYPLYQWMAVGGKIDLKIAPYYWRYFYKHSY